MQSGDDCRTREQKLSRELPPENEEPEIEFIAGKGDTIET
jgi:hypothetical protein